jgi:hypothetical protein
MGMPKKVKRIRSCVAFNEYCIILFFLNSFHACPHIADDTLLPLEAKIQKEEGDELRWNKSEAQNEGRDAVCVGQTLRSFAKTTAGNFSKKILCMFCWELGENRDFANIENRLQVCTRSVFL